MLVCDLLPSAKDLSQHHSGGTVRFTTCSCKRGLTRRYVDHDCAHSSSAEVSTELVMDMRAL